jgi:hypothetical protein
MPELWADPDDRWSASLAVKLSLHPRLLPAEALLTARSCLHCQRPSRLVWQAGARPNWILLLDFDWQTSGLESRTLKVGRDTAGDAASSTRSANGSIARAAGVRAATRRLAARCA